MKKDKPVILGLGNPLFQDEGLGIHAIHRLMRESIAEYTELVDGGTDALALLGLIEAAEHLLVIDAIDGDYPAGTIKQFTREDIYRGLSNRMSPHQISFQDVLSLAVLRGRIPAHLLLIGVQPYCLDWGTELSPQIAEKLPQVTNMVYQQIGLWIG